MNEEERNNIEPELDSAAAQAGKTPANPEQFVAEEAAPAQAANAQAVPDQTAYPMPEAQRDAAALYGTGPAAAQAPLPEPFADQTQAFPTQPFASIDQQPFAQGQPLPETQPFMPGQMPYGGQPVQPAQPFGAAQPGMPAQPGQPAAPAQPGPIPSYQPFGAARPTQPMPPYGMPQPGQPFGAPNAPGMPQPGQPFVPGAPGQPPYQPGQPYQQPPMPQGVTAEAPKRKKWPIVLGVIAAILALGVTACTAFACGAAATAASSLPSEITDALEEEGIYGTQPGDPNRDSNGQADPDSTYSYSLDDITNALGSDLKADVSNGKFKQGIYVVGEDIEPGLYYLEGSKSAEGHYYTFDSVGDGKYTTDDSVVYFGNYFVNLEKGDVFVFLPAESGNQGFLASDYTCDEKAPYECGTYRVGIDIPAGTYTITVSDAAADVAKQDCAAFVMKDLEFEDGSVTDTKYVTRGSSQEITVKDGEYLELYGTVATAGTSA